MYSVCVGVVAAGEDLGVEQRSVCVCGGGGEVAAVYNPCTANSIFDRAPAAIEFRVTLCIDTGDWHAPAPTSIPRAYP